MAGEIEIQICFLDDAALSLAGVSVPGQVKVKVEVLPRTGEFVRFFDVNYKSGELAMFRVSSVAHLLGGKQTQTIQLSLELVVLHQP